MESRQTDEPAAGPQQGIYGIDTQGHGRQAVSLVGGALSPREFDVLRLLAMTGGSNKSIGIALGTSHETVKQQMRAVLRKTGSHNRTAAATAFRSIGEVARDVVEHLATHQEQVRANSDASGNDAAEKPDEVSARLLSNYESAKFAAAKHPSPSRRDLREGTPARQDAVNERGSVDDGGNQKREQRQGHADNPDPRERAPERHQRVRLGRFV